jgi:hypothetical protein
MYGHPNYRASKEGLEIVLTNEIEKKDRVSWNKNSELLDLLDIFLLTFWNVSMIDLVVTLVFS